MITRFGLLFRDWTFERFVKVGRAYPDLVMTKGPVRCYVEVERTRKSDRQLAKKFKKYKGTDGFVLVVCLTEKRLERIRKLDSAKDQVLCSTFPRLASGMPEPWMDGTGKSIRI